MGRPSGGEQHRRQEEEANRFAIELLAPERLIQSRLKRSADLEDAIGIADDLEISREAAVRRYVELHDECLAAVFSVDGRVRYVEKGEGFPATTIWSGDRLPDLGVKPIGDSDLTTLDEVSAGVWIASPEDMTVFAQTLFQREGYTTTLLVLEFIEGELEDDGM